MADLKKTILVCVDDSPISENAFKWYLNNFHNPSYKLILLTVAEFWGDVGMMMSPATVQNCIDKRDKHVKDLEGKYNDICKQCQVSATFHIIYGQKAEQYICEYAKEINADTIVMGTRGMGAVKRAVLGSVSMGVLHHSHIPVLIYKM